MSKSIVYNNIEYIMLYGHHDYGETPDIVKHYQTGTGH